MISVLPNKGPNIVFEGNGLNEGEGVAELDTVQVMKANGRSSRRDAHILNLHTNNNAQNTSLKMNSLIIGEATRIISKRADSDVSNMKENIGQMQEALKENDLKLSKIENKIDVLFKQLSEEIRCYQKKVGM